MAEILQKGPRLRLRRAEMTDIDYICALQEENSDYIVPFPRTVHETIISQAEASIDIIVEEQAGGARVGYLHATGLLLDTREQEWTHVVFE